MNDDSLFADFQEIYKKNNLADSGNFIIKDGIINAESYNLQRRKILIIAKEHNFVKKDKQLNGYEGDYRHWWNAELNYTFSHRIGEWCFGIADDFNTAYQEISREQKKCALRSIAFINVKKTGGGSSSNSGTLLSYIQVSRDLLHRQIMDIKPDLIICCFRDDHYVNRLFDCEVPMQRALSNHYSLGTWQGRRVVNFYHPSARKKKQFLFEQIREATKI